MSREAESWLHSQGLAALVTKSRSRYCLAMAAVEEIKKQALALGVKERIQLAESLLRSLPPVAREWSEAEDLAEAERRDHEIETNRAQALHDGEFWQRVDARRQK
jgi:putative addiction module component (TIGR02574 family)